MHDLFAWPRAVASATAEAAASLAGVALPAPPALMPTLRCTMHQEGCARLYRFERPAGAPPASGLPLLLVPSMINRWYVLDLRRGASVVEALTAAGLDVWCLDWGGPEDEDRHLDWDAVLARLARAARKVLRATGAPRLGVLGYCMGATLATIHAALAGEQVAALVNLAGPIDFAAGGALRCMVDPQWFDPDAVADAGNVSPAQMQSGFSALRPTLDAAKLMNLPELFLGGADKARAREAFLALEAWASDNIAFPAAAYRTYIRELYQGNALVEGRHHVRGRRVDLGAIRCPVLTIVAERDTICPPPAALALNERVGSTDTSVIFVPGGHVGAVVGSRAAHVMYPPLAAWLRSRLA